MPTIYDYHIVFISPSAISNYSHSYYLQLKEDQFSYLVRPYFGGIIVAAIVGGNKYYENWAPGVPELKEVSGEKILFNNDHWISHILNKYLQAGAMEPEFSTCFLTFLRG